MTMFWREAIVFCGKCKRRVEKVLGYTLNDETVYEFMCHKKSLIIKSSEQEKYRVNGPVSNSYLVFNTGNQKRITKSFSLTRL